MKYDLQESPTDIMRLSLRKTAYGSVILEGHQEGTTDLAGNESPPYKLVEFGTLPGEPDGPEYCTLFADLKKLHVFSYLDIYKGKQDHDTR